MTERTMYMLSVFMLSGCFSQGLPGAEDTSPDAPVIEDTETDPTTSDPLVILITVDTLNSRFLNINQADWNVSPNLDLLFSESVIVDDIIAPRGVTLPSMVSMITGEYPRSHGTRGNIGADGSLGNWDGSIKGFLEVLQEEGWYTYGYSSNMCESINFGIDSRLCTHPAEMPEIESQVVGDQFLVTSLLEALETRPSDQPAFAWLHLMDPHTPYVAVSPYYDEFHPQEYNGRLPSENLSATPTLGVIILEDTMTDADREHLQASYASQIRGVDTLIGDFLTGLKDSGLYTDAVIIFGADHGEEVGLYSSWRRPGSDESAGTGSDMAFATWS